MGSRNSSKAICPHEQDRHQQAELLQPLQVPDVAFVSALGENKALLWSHSPQCQLGLSSSPFPRTMESFLWKSPQRPLSPNINPAL